MKWLLHFFVYTLLVFSPVWARTLQANDSTKIKLPSTNGMRQCCTTTVEQRNWILIDCYPGWTWNCPYPGYGNAGPYAGQFRCPDNYVLMNFSTYEKWNVYWGRFQQMVRAAWCAPVKYQCTYVPSTQQCKN